MKDIITKKGSKKGNMYSDIAQITKINKQIITE